MAMLQAIVFGYTMSWPQKLDHNLRCITEQFTEPVNWQYDGQETAAALDGLQVSDCPGSARRRQDN